MELKEYTNYLIIDGENYGLIRYVESVTENSKETFLADGSILSSWDPVTHIILETEEARITVRKAMWAGPVTKEKKLPTKTIVDSGDIYSMDITWSDNSMVNMIEKWGELAMQLGISAQAAGDAMSKLSDSFHEVSTYGTINYGSDFEQDGLKKVLPGLLEEVRCPECSDNDILWETVQHMNDEHEWSREKIADWLETLDVDITFQIGESNGNED